MTRAIVDRDRAWLILAAIVAVPFGLAVGLRPTETVIAVAVAVAAIGCILLPMRHLPAVLLAVTIVMPSLVFQGVAGSGQARAVILILILALARVLMSRSRIPVPGILPLAVGAALGLSLMTALVATSRPASQVGSFSDLTRTLSYPAAAVTGFIAGAYARTQRTSLTIPRAFAWLTLVAALASVWYWAWKALGVAPLSHGLFHQIAATVPFRGRSAFPFLEDSPNLGAVMFVVLCAFAVPPLMLASTHRDRLLGLVAVAATLAAVLTTQSRTGLFAAGAGALTYLFLVTRGGGRRSAAVLVLVLLSSVGAYVFGTFPAERASGDTLQARVQIWGQAGRAFLDDPIIGHGYEYSLVGNFIQQEYRGSTSRTQSAHSDLLSALVDGGVLGAAVSVAIFGLMFAVARSSMQDPVARPLGIGYSCTLAALVVGGIDNTLSQSAATVTLEWLMFGVMVGISAGLIQPAIVPSPDRLRVGNGRRAANEDLRLPAASKGVIPCAE